MGKPEGFEVSEIPNLNGYVAIVTGGNSGIGYETTQQLARHGARVYIASRSLDRVTEAIKSMQKTQPSLDLHFLKLDLQDLQSIKATAAEFMSREGRLDLLINNAGIMNSPYGLTKDGHELQWQTNFLSHHALTLALLPLLRTTAQGHPETRDRVRIINVSSDLSIYMAPKEIVYHDPNMSDFQGPLGPQRRYGHSKSASILAAAAINARYSHMGVTAYSLHPGVIKSNLQSHDTSFMGTVTRGLMKIQPTTSALDGSRTTLFCATSPDAVREAGQFLQPFGKHNPKGERWTKDKGRQDKLWVFAEKQLKGHGFIFDL